MHELVQDGLNYLNKRADFWRQQKPLYARKKDNKQPRQKKNYATRDQAAVKKLSKFMKKLEEIDAGMTCFLIEIAVFIMKDIGRNERKGGGSFAEECFDHYIHHYWQLYFVFFQILYHLYLLKKQV